MFVPNLEFSFWKRKNKYVLKKAYICNLSYLIVNINWKFKNVNFN